MTMTTGEPNRHVLQDDDSSPKTMVEALGCENPAKSLMQLSKVSRIEASARAVELAASVKDFDWSLPDNLSQLSDSHDVYSLEAAIACSDSIAQTLSKIASGGSQASQEIRQLEAQKRDIEDQARAVEAAIVLRRNSEQAFQALQSKHWQEAAAAVRPWLLWKNETDMRESNVARQCRAYAGEYCLKQLATAYTRLKESLLQLYEEAVREGNLQALGQLTPILGMIELESEAVRLYLQYLKGLLQRDIESFSKGGAQNDNQPPFMKIGRVYNTSVSCIRHHLPMVAHCLHKADGDAAVVQLVHQIVEESVIPELQAYQTDRQLSSVSTRANTIYSLFEERFTGRRSTITDDGTDGANEDDDDCGFSTSIGSLSDVDVAMDEAARCIQHSESYLRFVHHTCNEINKARRIRFDQAQQEARAERDRQEWSTGRKAELSEEKFEDLQVLPKSTPLHLTITEIGGQYASVERCLLLASMQRAFLASPENDARYFRPASGATSPNCKALQTALVEACFFSARHSTQRAFATGHVGTASAMANFTSDCLSGVLVTVLSQRAEDTGIALLKPGEGLLVGSAGLFNNASNLIRQGTHATAGSKTTKEELLRRQKVDQDLSQACATLNDLEAAAHHSQQLEQLLGTAVEKGYTPNAPETEQLKMCVKSLSSITLNFREASVAAIESLESVLKPRLRSIVGEAVGGENAAANFMGSSVMGGGKGADRSMTRMHYDLDEDAYNLLQVSESYVTRLCTLLGELLDPLRVHLVPRLWDMLLLSVIGTVAKRLETSLRKCRFTALGSLALDSDIRDILSYTKDRLYSPEYSSNTIAVTKSCPSLARLLQICKLLSVDDLDDVFDLIGSAKRKGNWDLKLEDSRSILCLRAEFDADKVNELMRLPDEGH